MWFVRVQQHLRSLIGAEEVGRQEQDEELRRMWERVYPETGEGEDVLQTMRECAGLAVPKALNARPDQLRSLGNMVVPQQGALALLTLLSR